MGESRTITGDNSSNRREQLSLETGHTLRWTTRVQQSLAWHMGKIKLLTGIATLGAAGAILALSGGIKSNKRGSQVTMTLAPLFFAAFSLFFLATRRDQQVRHLPE